MKMRFVIRVLLFVSAAGLLVFVAGSGLLRPLRDRAAGWALPVLTTVARGAEAVRGWLGGASGERLAELEAERIRLLAELGRREDLRRENEVLEAALTLRREGEAGAILAAVVAFLREGRDEVLLLNRGTEDGVGVGDLVVDRAGILGGTVSSVGTRVSRVILLSSPSRSTDVVVAGRDLRAIVRGANFRELIVELVPQDAGLEAGELLLASPRSSGGRRALVVGEVREVRQAEHETFKTVRAVHLFDPATDDVLVLLAP